jgi:hypothetical protein
MSEDRKMAEEPRERAFTVSDKRFSARRESASDRPADSPQASRPSTAEQQTRAAPSEEVSFASFLVSLGTQAFMHLGEIPNPLNQKREKDLPAAKQLIDLLGVLEAKTKGNLTGEEERILQQLLFDLRLHYVREAGR